MRISCSGRIFFCVRNGERSSRSKSEENPEWKCSWKVWVVCCPVFVRTKFFPFPEWLCKERKLRGRNFTAVFWKRNTVVWKIRTRRKKQRGKNGKNKRRKENYLMRLSVLQLPQLLCSLAFSKLFVYFTLESQTHVAFLPVLTHNILLSLESF